MLNYNTTFGIQKSEKSALIGPFYYFTNYINAIKKGGWSAQNEKHDEGGIIRFAVFPLKTYSLFIIQNYQNKIILILEKKLKKQILNMYKKQDIIEITMVTGVTNTTVHILGL